MKVVPQFLYRGVVVDELTIKTKTLLGIDLTPPNPPKYDKNGRKTVGDGNEYGVYMSDNKDVALTCYGGGKQSFGIPLSSIQIGEKRHEIAMPRVGILYKISTENLDVRRPWISSVLRLEYNNGMKGDEWIADRIPACNYEIEKVIVDADILHSQKNIEFEKQDEIMPKIEKELSFRRKRLEKFLLFIESNPQIKPSSIDENTLSVYIEIFTENGLIETDLDTMVLSNVNDCIKFLMVSFYKRTPDSIPMEELRYLIKLQREKYVSFSDLKVRLLSDLRKTIQNKNLFIEKRLGKDINTVYFDNKIMMILSMLELYHQMILNQISKLTGLSLDIDVGSTKNVSNIVLKYNKKIDELFFDGEISFQLRGAMKSEIREIITGAVMPYDLTMEINKLKR